MNEQEPARECIRIDRDDAFVRILVGTITWDGPAHPELSWSVFAQLPHDASDQDVEHAVEKTLASSHFATCRECGQRNPLGWMHDDRICQRCAQEHHGVVY